METLTCLMVSRRSTKIFPPLYSNERACGEGQCAGSMHRSQQSLPSCTCVKHCVVGRLLCARKPGVFPLFPACQGFGMHGGNQSLHSGWWQQPHRPAFGIQVAGIHRDEPDGGYLGQCALNPNRHGIHFTMSNNLFQNVTTYQLLHINVE